MEMYRARTAETKEPETLDWLDRVLRPGDVFFDVGANIGLYSLYAALSRVPVTVFAFEPSIYTAATLGLNVSANRAAITVCPYALSDRNGASVFHLVSSEPGMSMHSFDLRHLEGFGQVSKTSHSVLHTTLDDLRGKLPDPTLLKIDVDGHEARVLRGARELLLHGSVRSMLVETNVFEGDPPSGPDPHETISAAGYALVAQGELHRLNSVSWSNKIYDRLSSRANDHGCF